MTNLVVEDCDDSKKKSTRKGQDDRRIPAFPHEADYIGHTALGKTKSCGFLYFRIQDTAPVGGLQEA